MLIDSHCHIPSRLYKKSIEEVIAAAQSEGVSKMISIGTSFIDNVNAAEVAKKFPGVYSTVAVYSHDELGMELSIIDARLREQLDSLGILSERGGKVVAIGECGVDKSNWEGGRSVQEQLELFELQLKIALDYSLPVTIHNRNGNDLVYALLKKYQPLGLKGVMHCFSSDWEFAQKILDLGFFVSFSGRVTYANKEDLLEAVKKVPLSSFLVETDAPYLVPANHKGEVNEPKYVKIVAEKVAQVKEEPFDVIAKHSYENTCRVFGIPL